MKSDLSYILDANVFIEAKRRYYAFDLAPGFWESLITHARNGEVRSIDRVREELLRGKDDLAAWVRDNLPRAFEPTGTESIINYYSSVMAWVSGMGQFQPAAIAEFAEGADGWLIAYAGVHHCTVVTHEEFSREVKRRVPIPNVCRQFGVKYVDTFSMLRSLGVTLR